MVPAAGAALKVIFAFLQFFLLTCYAYKFGELDYTEKLDLKFLMI